MNSIHIPGNANTFQLRLNEDGYFRTVDGLVFVVEADLFRLRRKIPAGTKLRKAKSRRVRADLIRHHLLANKGRGRLILTRNAIDDIYCLALRHDNVNKMAVALTRIRLCVKGWLFNAVLGYYL